MKQVIVFIGLLLLLTGCFGGEKPEIDKQGVSIPADVVEDINTSDITTASGTQTDTPKKDGSDDTPQVIEAGSSDETDDSGVVIDSDTSLSDEEQERVEAILDEEGDFDILDLLDTTQKEIDAEFEKISDNID